MNTTDRQSKERWREGLIHYKWGKINLYPPALSGDVGAFPRPREDGFVTQCAVFTPSADLPTCPPARH